MMTRTVIIDEVWQQRVKTRTQHECESKEVAEAGDELIFLTSGGCGQEYIRMVTVRSMLFMEQF